MIEIKKIIFSIFILSHSLCDGQILSSFTWESGNITTASSGNNAASVSSSATISSGGSSGNGLNPGLPKADLDLTITATSIYDTEGVDISFDYQREESIANFYIRGSSLNIGMNAGNLFVSYRVSNGAGSYTLISSGNVFSIPNDDIFRTYRFKYIAATGYGELFVNGTSMWANDGIDNRSMYWTGAGNIVIGSLMDGSGSNKTCLDGFSISRIGGTLPIDLVSFVAKAEKENVNLNWTTASEKNNDYFTIEKSQNGIMWNEIAKVAGAGNSNHELNYYFIDKNNNVNGTYYRLKQTDFDGKLVITGEQFVQYFFKEWISTIYPNPAHERLNIKVEKQILTPEITVLNSLGNTINLPVEKFGDHYSLNTNSIEKGIYILSISQDQQTRNILFEKN